MYYVNDLPNVTPQYPYPVPFFGGLVIIFFNSAFLGGFGFDSAEKWPIGPDRVP